MLTINQIAERLGLETPHPDIAESPIRHLLTDSRSLLSPSDTLFFAISTPTGSGIRYLLPLYKAGVRNFIIPSDSADIPDLPGAWIAKVENPVSALQTICRRNAHTPAKRILAITGSRGKTAIKEFISRIEGPLKSVSRSPRSFNSRIGVPLSMWGIHPDTDLAVIEAGISRQGEMEALRLCIRPDDVLLGDILSDHDEGFPDFHSKVREKASLAKGASRVFYCSDDTMAAKALAEIAPEATHFTWSLRGNPADLKISEISQSELPSHMNGSPIAGYRFKAEWGGETMHMSVNLPAFHDLRNAIFALLYFLADGHTLRQGGEALNALVPFGTRLSVADGVNGSTIIWDDYPADPDNLLPALDFMHRRITPTQHPALVLAFPAGQTQIAILNGEDLMPDTNLDTRDKMEQMALMIEKAGIRDFYGVGLQFEKFKNLFPDNSLFFKNPGEAAEHFKQNPPKDALILLSSTTDQDFSSIRETLEIRTHETILEVNLDAMIRNYNYFKSHLPADCGLIAMVKASGYGAGSYEIAKTLQDAGAAFLAVAVLDEGLDLRRRGITMPIMVMNPRVAEYAEMFSARLEPEIYSLQMLRDVIDAARKNNVQDYPIHIKLDTGMHRMGFIPEEVPELMDIVNSQQNVKISSVFSHLATADCPDLNSYTLSQLHLFDSLSSQMLAQSKTPFKRHILNSAGILRFPEFHYDMARLGIGLYGINTLPEEMEKPLAIVSELSTVIINLRHWPAGTSIGYAGKGILHRDSTIATIPIGYADGMNRLFGRGAIEVGVNGHLCPTVGNICMDACMIDVTGVECAVGDRVEIFGRNLPVGRLSDATSTIPYEILTSVSPRVKRIYFRE